MKTRPTFPSTAVRNADFVTGRRKPGRVLDLQVDLESLPPVGMLVVHEDTVKAMVAKLGWKLEQDDQLEAARNRTEELEAELEQIRTIMSDMTHSGFTVGEPDRAPVGA